MNVFVTGGAGFIGSNLTDRLLQLGHSVKVYDNFSTGQREFLAQASQSPGFTLTEGDTLSLETLTRAMKGSDLVFHVAANADVRFGLQHPRKDLEQNTIATFNVLEAAHTNGVPLMIVPQKEVAAARRGAGNVRVVGVKNIDEALRDGEAMAKVKAHAFSIAKSKLIPDYYEFKRQLSSERIGAAYRHDLRQ